MQEELLIEICNQNHEVIAMNSLHLSDMWEVRQLPCLFSAICFVFFLAVLLHQTSPPYSAYYLQAYFLIEAHENLVPCIMDQGLSFSDSVYAHALDLSPERQAPFADCQYASPHRDNQYTTTQEGVVQLPALQEWPSQVSCRDLAWAAMGAAE